MKVTVKLFATLTDYLPADSHNNQVEVDVAETDPVDSVLARFNLPKRMVHLVLINGTYVPPTQRASRRLAAGDHLAVWPPIAGG
jgi:molybdopterin converting factor small subunit